MKVFQVEGDWTMDNARVSSRPVPVAGPGQVRIAMRATSVNYRDMLVPGRGYGRRMQELPLILLSDGAGVVDAVGEGVTRFKPGDGIFANIFDLGTGALAEFALVPESAAASIAPGIVQ